MDFDIVSNLNWIGEHIWAALKQMGGVAILTVIMTFITHKINVRFEKRIEHKYDQKLEELKVELDKQRESHKSMLEKRNYVSKTRFDTEFSIVKELMMSCKTMIDAVYFLFPNRNAEPLYDQGEKWSKQHQDYWVKAATATRDFGVLMEGNSAFISKEIYEEFKKIESECRTNILCYMYRNENDPLNNGVSQEKREYEIKKAYERTWEIEQKMTAIADMLRQHFQDMDIQE